MSNATSGFGNREFALLIEVMAYENRPNRKQLLAYVRKMSQFLGSRGMGWWPRAVRESSKAPFQKSSWPAYLWTSGSSGFKASYHRAVLTYVLLKILEGLVAFALDLQALRSQQIALRLRVSRKIDRHAEVVHGLFKTMDGGKQHASDVEIPPVVIFRAIDALIDAG